MVDEKGELIFHVKKWRLAVPPIVLTSFYAVLSVIVWMLELERVLLSFPPKL